MTLTFNVIWPFLLKTWWRHQMETFSALLALCAGNSPVNGEFPTQRPVTRSFDVFFNLCVNKRVSKQSWGWWFETRSRSLWRHCNEMAFNFALEYWSRPAKGRYLHVPNVLLLDIGLFSGHAIVSFYSELSQTTLSESLKNWKMIEKLSTLQHCEILFAQNYFFSRPIGLKFCTELCIISKWLNDWNGSCGRTRFHSLSFDISFDGISYIAIAPSTDFFIRSPFYYKD